MSQTETSAYMSTGGAQTEHRVPSRLRHSRNLTWLSYAALLLLLAYINGRGGRNTILLGLLYCLPLLLLLPALLRRSYRGYSVLALVSIVYFIVAVPGTMSATSNWLDYLILVLSIALFFSSVFTSRWLQRWRAHDFHGQINSHDQINNEESS